MAARKYVNFFSSKLTAQLLAAGTSVTITTGDNALLTAGTSGTDWYMAVVRRMSGFKVVAQEVVKISAWASNPMTIVRAQEGTTALQFEIGDQIDVDYTAASFSGGAIEGFVDGETPSGSINGSNVTFTLATAPNPPASLRVFVNGIRQRLTTDYTLSSLTISFVVAATPQSGDNIIADYRY